MGSLASSLFIPIDYKWFQLADKWFPGKALRKVTRIFIHIKFDKNLMVELRRFLLLLFASFQRSD